MLIDVNGWAEVQIGMKVSAKQFDFIKFLLKNSHYYWIWEKKSIQTKFLHYLIEFLNKKIC